MKTRTSNDNAARDAGQFVIGQLVMLKQDVERFPHALVKAGAVGTVVAVEDGYGVRLHELVDGLEEWENVLLWQGDIKDDFAKEVMNFSQYVNVAAIDCEGRTISTQVWTSEDQQKVAQELINKWQTERATRNEALLVSAIAFGTATKNSITLDVNSTVRVALTPRQKRLRNAAEFALDAVEDEMMDAIREGVDEYFPEAHRNINLLMELCGEVQGAIETLNFS